MKKRIQLLLITAIMLSILVVTAQAATFKPGDTVTANISYSSDAPLKALQANYKLSGGLQFVSVTGSGMDVTGSSVKAVGFSMGGVLNGSITITAKINADATGDQTIQVTSVTGGVSGETTQRTVAPAKTHTFTLEGPSVTWSDWTVRTAPTCTEAGLEFRTSSENIEETRVVPALGHKFGEWKVTTPATCTAAGVETRICSIDNVSETRVIPALGHKFGDWKVITPATCTVAGVETRVCPIDNVTETRAIPKLAHKEGKWEVVRAATEEMPGLRVKKCLIGGEILVEEAIPFKTTTYYTKNTMTSWGPRFRDLENPITKKWYMFTPLDLSQEGEQTFPLIASNMYILGAVKVMVNGGNVTITYTVPNRVNVRSEFLTIFPNLASVNDVDPQVLAQQAYSFGTPISIENNLGGDTNVLMYIQNVIDYTDEVKGIVRYTGTNEAHMAGIENFLNMMD